MSQTRPKSSVFADGTKRARPLAIHPDAIGVSYPTRKVFDRSTYELREMCASDVAEIVDGVAVLCVDGPLEHKSGDGWWSYWQTYEELARDFALLTEDDEVRAVILKFDSPGGECAGLNETVRIMQEMKQASRKPVFGYVDEACYSAAYALAMVCDEIYMPLSAGVGSIGVITAMADCTEADKKAGYRIEVIASGSKKTDGHPHVALTEGAIKRTRKTVDKLAASFFEIVSTGRGIPTETIAGFQAGVFTGQDAVNAGLADGIMSLQECLHFASNPFRSSNNSAAKKPADKEDAPMGGTLAAAKALNDANKALAAAKTDGERALAAARVLAAEEVVAKVKKTKTVTTDTHEEEVDDGEPEDKDDGEDEDDKDDKGDGDDSEDEDSETSAALSAPAPAASKNRLLNLARKITGKHALDEVMGALHAMHDSHKKTSKLAAQVAKLEADAVNGRVSALISQGMKAGKLAPSQKAWARTQSPASLKAYLDAAPKMVRGVDEEHTEASVSGTGIGAVSAEMSRIWKKQGFAEKDFPKLLSKMNGNKTTNGAG